MGRARNPYLEGELTWQGFHKIKEEAEGLLAGTYVPEFDDAVEAGNILHNFGTSWGTASVARRNRRLRTMLHAVYANLGETSCRISSEGCLFRANTSDGGAGKRSGPSWRRYGFRRDGGDGGESNSPSKRPLD